MYLNTVLVVVLSFLFTNVNCQPIIGTLFLDESTVDDTAYTLFYPNHQTEVFLIDNCGGLVHSWQLPENSFPGSKAILDSQGNLYVAMSNPDFVNTPTFGAGGAGGVMEQYNWDGELQWRYTIVDSLQRQHHDFELMPNGNILALSWIRHSLEEMIEMGFDTLRHSQRSLWSDALIEFDPQEGEVVWMWDAWDHLIQDHDSTKMNFGVVSDDLARIDVNYLDFTFGRSDWLHANSVSYSPELDQVVISVRNFHELWVVDHSTTTQEATSSSGGKSGRGGDLLYRWGNPLAYQDTIQPKMLNFQHDASWYKDEELDITQILVYNNVYAPDTSLCHLLNPVFDKTTQRYLINEQTNSYFPATFSQTFSHPDTTKGFSAAGSSVQILDNDNILMCAARQGRIFEVTTDGELAWEYLIPFRNGFPLPQGSELNPSDNFNFEARKYPKSYIPEDAILPEEPITLEFGDEPSYCDVAVSIEQENISDKVSIWPNPISDKVLRFDAPLKYTDRRYRIFDTNGNLVISGQVDRNNAINLHNCKSGIFIMHIDGIPSIMFVVL